MRIECTLRNVFGNQSTGECFERTIRFWGSYLLTNPIAKFRLPYMLIALSSIAGLPMAGVGCGQTAAGRLEFKCYVGSASELVELSRDVTKNISIMLAERFAPLRSVVPF